MREIAEKFRDLSFEIKREKWMNKLSKFEVAQCFTTDFFALQRTRIAPDEC